MEMNVVSLVFTASDLQSPILPNWNESLIMESIHIKTKGIRRPHNGTRPTQKDCMWRDKWCVLIVFTINDSQSPLLPNWNENLTMESIHIKTKDIRRPYNGTRRTQESWLGGPPALCTREKTFTQTTLRASES